MNTLIKDRISKISSLETLSDEIIYPDSDGKPMADNTQQFRWIVKIKESLERLFINDPNVFVAGDLLWYPVKGNNKIRVAPDALVAIGRPKGDRGSYRTWDEDDVVPQVVFEILSPGNTPAEMAKKLAFYDCYGVEEYYLYDPDSNRLQGWMRSGKIFEPIENINGWISPNLRIRFILRQDTLEIFGPDGRKFLTPVELEQQYQEELSVEREHVKQERQRTQQERQRAEQERQRAEQERQRAEKLAAKLRELGIEPE